jgi:hypothetical protein
MSEGAADIVRLCVVAVNAVLRPCILRLTSQSRKPYYGKKLGLTVDGQPALGSSRSVILLRVVVRLVSVSPT